MKNRVVVTGLGAITPLGNTVDEFWNSICEGKSGIDYIKRFDVQNFSTRIAGEVKDFSPENYMEKKDAKRMDRFTQYAMAATQMAMKDANINLESIEPDRFGVILGSGVGGIETLENQANILTSKGPGRVSPFFVPMMIGNMAAGQISIALGAKGINSTVVTACASATNAIGEAYKAIKHGDADIIITGGSEAPITPLSLAGFCSLKAMSVQNDNPQKASRPFDSKRDGFVMGEGAGILVLESLSHAKARGANILGEVVGYGLTADAYHITAPAPNGEGGSRAILQSINDAGITPDMIDYINAHGTSTPYNDKFETIAIKNVLGEHAYNTPISSTKSMTGHLLGAAGGIEAIILIKAIQNQFVPPTINYEIPDPECDLDYIPNKGRQAKVDYALSNSFGFGGHNACILMKRIIE